MIDQWLLKELSKYMYNQGIDILLAYCPDIVSGCMQDQWKL